MLEFLILFPIVCGVMLTALAMFHTAFARVHCAYQVFEAAHRELTGSSGLTPLWISVSPAEAGVQARGQCQKLTEQVRLPDLEHAQW